MHTLVEPFIVNDRGDVYVYTNIATMYADIEAVDASTLDFFDGEGRPIGTVTEGFHWHLDETVVADAEPHRVILILLDYFARLPDEYGSFSARATAESSLGQLVELRRELSNAAPDGRWTSLFRRPLG